MPYADRDRRLEYLRTYRQTHVDERDRKDWRTERRANLRRIVKEHKDRPCMDCGIKYPPYVMDFDHRPGAPKVHDIHRMITRLAAVAVLLAEIAKCDVVCSNCHRERSARRGWSYGADGCSYNEEVAE